MRLFPTPPTGWETRVVTCSALTRDGIDGLWDVVLEHDTFMKAGGWFEQSRRQQVKSWMYEMIEYGLSRHFRDNRVVREKLPEYERDVLEGRVSSFRAAQRLLAIYTESKS